MESLMDIVGQNLRLTSSHKKQHLQKRCPDHQGLVLMDMSQKDPCQKQACDIQKCLQANNYMESKCEAVIQELRRCCAQYPKGRSVVCSGFEKEDEERQKHKAASK
ncbi:cx9C motif-containing protein 4 isoform X4 [Monodelphis domestica]|nr:cx9C motif-containing protein 4 isoform X4 [Monodelphis domestica]